VEYLDFDVSIGALTAAYPVSVLSSPAGEPRGALTLPFTGLELQTRLQAIEIAVLKSSGGRRRVLAPEDRAVQEFGRAMFDALISGDVRSSYDVSRSLAQREGKGLRVRLRIEPPELAVLPWEFLYDPRQGEFLCLSVFTPVVRYLDLPGSVAPVEVSPPLRVLAMAATPEDQAPLNVERERRRITAALEPLQRDGKVEVTWLESQTWRGLQRAMRQGPWHIFHFVGHGRFDPERDEGYIELADEAGRSQPLTATQLGRLLADHPTLRLVQLNACEGARGSSQDIFSGTASILVRRGLPAVLAMQYEISDVAAVEFSRSFYEALADGLPVDAACAEARKAISLSRPMTLEWGTPVLCMRTPDGALFSVRPGDPGTAGSKLGGGTARSLGRPPVDEPEPEEALESPGFSRLAEATEPRTPPASPPHRPKAPSKSRVWAALIAAALIVAAIAAFALTSSGGGTGTTSTQTTSPSAPASPSLAGGATASAGPLPSLDTSFRHRSGYPFDLRYPSSWGEQRHQTEDSGEYSWLSPSPSLLEPPSIFSDPMREALVSDPGRVIGAIVPEVVYGFDRATFEASLELDPTQPIDRSRVEADADLGISADRIEGITVDPGDSGLSMHVVAYGYEITPNGAGVWIVIVFVASDQAWNTTAAEGALFDAMAGTVDFFAPDIESIRG
jgi:CHAT domain